MMALARNLFLGRKHAGGTPYVNKNIPSLNPLHNAGHQFTLPRFKLVKNRLSFCLANSLDNDLLGGLRRDPTEFFVMRQRKFQFIPGFYIRRFFFFSLLNLNMLLLVKTVFLREEKHIKIEEEKKISPDVKTGDELEFPL